MHEVEQACEKRHAACLVRRGYRYSNVRLHRVNSEKHLKIQKAQHQIESGTRCGRQMSERPEPSNHGRHSEGIGGVGQAAMVKVNGGFVLEDIAPNRFNIPHVRRHEGVAH